MCKYSFYIGFICILAFQTTIGRQIHFQSEDIELTVEDSTCTVKGLYWFSNKSPDPLQTTLFYPFVVDEQLPYPDSIYVFDETRNQHVGFIKSKTGILFRVMLSSLGTAFYRVTYRQKTTDRQMKYLLLTTKWWGEPLEQARYRIQLPDKLILTSSTIHFFEVKEQGGEQIYETCLEHYMPTTDFIIQWERRLP